MYHFSISLRSIFQNRLEETSITLLLASENQIFLMKFKKFILSHLEPVQFKWNPILFKSVFGLMFLSSKEKNNFLNKHLWEFFVLFDLFIIIAVVVRYCVGYTNYTSICLEISLITDFYIFSGSNSRFSLFVFTFAPK